MAPALSTIRASQIPTIHLGIDYGHSCIRVFQQKVEDGGEPTVGNAELVLLQNGQEQAEQLLSFTRRIIDGKEKFYCTYGADAQHEWDVRRDVEANAGPRVFLRSLKECFFETKDSEQCRQENARALREGFGKSISLEWVVKEHLDVVHRDVMAQLLRRYGKTYGVREVADWALVTTVTVPEPKANDSSSPEVSPFHGAVKKSKFAAGRNTFKFISEADSSAAFGFHRRPEQDGGHVHRFRLVTDLGGSTLDTCLSKLADEALQGEPWGFDILFFRKLIKIIKRRLAKKAKLPIADLAARLGMSVQEFNIDLRERLDTYKDEWRMSDKWQRHFFVTSIPNGDYDIYVDVYRSEVERLKDEMGDMIIGEILRICDSIELPQGSMLSPKQQPLEVSLRPLSLGPVPPCSLL
ncbi:hypothetical protein PRZ48_012199 [Zasmidium cellare]|uniref:Uncharacterized protein n=1 Tax=Zasmidium cellare TaxID=395010 RepID=A0ABR0E482_ZASCE|nr:hypothetical protein PRZ48_012199 [Zasmidium cellare]